MAVVRTPLDEEIESALRRVHDPCSIAAKVPVDLVDMGLVRDWSLVDGQLRVTMCLTAITCTMAPHFMEAAERELLTLAAVDSVDIEIDHRVTWTERDMSPAARRRLELRRADARTRVRPQQWRERVG